MHHPRNFAAAALVAATLAAGAAQAVPVLTDNFDGENGGVAASPYTGWVNFGVSQGDVGLIEGVRCVGGSGGCVNLGATRGTGTGSAFETSTGYAYGVGSLVTLTYQISGHQVECCSADDFYAAGFNFGAIGASVDHYTFDGVDSGTLFIPGHTVTSSDGFPVFSNTPWTSHTISFVATDVGTVKARFISSSDDGLGPLLDNVGLDITDGAVPEPASWALMITGFGLAGAALRRRQRGIATA